LRGIVGTLSFALARDLTTRAATSVSSLIECTAANVTSRPTATVVTTCVACRRGQRSNARKRWAGASRRVWLEAAAAAARHVDGPSAVPCAARARLFCRGAATTIHRSARARAQCVRPQGEGNADLVMRKAGRKLERGLAAEGVLQAARTPMPIQPHATSHSAQRAHSRAPCGATKAAVVRRTTRQHSSNGSPHCSRARVWLRLSVARRGGDLRAEEAVAKQLEREQPRELQLAVCHGQPAAKVGLRDRPNKRIQTPNEATRLGLRRKR
jgi:hypothetical protein